MVVSLCVGSLQNRWNVVSSTEFSFDPMWITAPYAMTKCCSRVYIQQNRHVPSWTTGYDGVRFPNFAQGVEVKHASLITVEEEKRLEVLLHTVFHLNGLICVCVGVKNTEI